MPNPLFNKWARLDSNQGPKDYESPGASLTPCFLRGEALPGPAPKCLSASQRRHSRGTVESPEIHLLALAPRGAVPRFADRWGSIYPRRLLARSGEPAGGLPRQHLS
jgi:hypothetical protein